LYIWRVSSCFHVPSWFLSHLSVFPHCSSRYLAVTTRLAALKCKNK
jgi:hypothetical protein